MKRYGNRELWRRRMEPGCDTPHTVTRCPVVPVLRGCGEHGEDRRKQSEAEQESEGRKVAPKAEAIQPGSDREDACIEHDEVLRARPVEADLKSVLLDVHLVEVKERVAVLPSIASPVQHSPAPDRSATHAGQSRSTSRAD